MKRNSLINFCKYTLAFVIGVSFSWYFAGDRNQELEYGKTGLPKNCRAIIKENIEAYEAKVFPANEVIASISRNCGANGHSW